MMTFGRPSRHFLALLGLLLAMCGVMASMAWAANTAPPTGKAGDYPSMFHDDSLRIIILEGVRLTFNDRFAAAESLYAHLALTFPQSPTGPLFAAATIHAQMLDSESPQRHADLERWLDEAKSRALRWHAIEAQNAEPEFVLGAAAGYEAVFESRWGGWLAALKQGLRSKGHFDAAIRRDPDLTDAYLGIGNYNYWKSVKTDFINWLPLIPDDKTKGLEQLRHVATAGLLAAAAGRVSLGWALINERRYEEALAQGDTLALLFPDGKGPLWIRALASFALSRWEQSRALYNEIERRILAEGPGNYYNLIDCAFFRAQCNFHSGRWSETLSECHKALAYPTLPGTRERQKNKLARLRRLQSELKEKVNMQPGDKWQETVRY